MEATPTLRNVSVERAPNEKSKPRSHWPYLHVLAKRTVKKNANDCQSLKVMKFFTSMSLHT